MEAVIGLIGVIIGFALSEVATHLRSRAAEKQQIDATRKMLRLEIGVNLTLLEQLWKRIHENDNKPGVVDVLRCNRLIQIPFPSFSSEGFKSHTPLLTYALSESEIASLFDLYTALTRLQDLRSIVIETRREDDENWRLASGGTGTITLNNKKGWAIPESLFSKKSPELYAEIKSIIEPLLARGNPIG